jgi:membrane associated rhomboid family serine protease
MTRRPYQTAALLVLCWTASLAFWSGQPVAEAAAQQWHSVSLASLFGERFWLYVGWSVVLHSGWSHLILNSVALAVCGSALERVWSPPRFGLLLLLSGLSASTAQAAWSGQGDIGVSGVVFACVGALTVRWYRGELPSAVLRITTGVLIVWFVVGALRGALGVSGIGNASHLIGLITGVAFGLAEAAAAKRRRPASAAAPFG